MAVIYTPYTMRVVINYTASGQHMANVLHVKKVAETAITYTDLQEAANAVLQWWVGTFYDNVGNGVVCNNVTADDVSSPSGLQYVAVPGTEARGSNVSPLLPNNVTFAIKFGTGLAGRSYRGRFYVVGLCESQVTANDLNSGTANGMVGDFATLAAGLAAEGLQHVIVSKQLNNVPREVGVATPVTVYSYTDLVVDTQRKRLH